MVIFFLCLFTNLPRSGQRFLSGSVIKLRLSTSLFRERQSILNPSKLRLYLCPVLRAPSIVSLVIAASWRAVSLSARGGKIGPTRWASLVHPELGPGWAIKLLARKKIEPNLAQPNMARPGMARPGPAPHNFFCLQNAIWPD